MEKEKQDICPISISDLVNQEESEGLAEDFLTGLNEDFWEVLE